MLRAVADTHAVVWYLYADERLSKAAKSTIDEAAYAGDQIAFSSITLAEIVYLSEKRHLARETLDRLPRETDGEDSVLVEIPFNRDPTIREKMAAAAFLVQFYNGIENILKGISGFREEPLPSGYPMTTDRARLTTGRLGRGQSPP